MNESVARSFSARLRIEGAFACVGKRTRQAKDTLLLSLARSLVRPLARSSSSSPPPPPSSSASASASSSSASSSSARRARKTSDHHSRSRRSHVRSHGRRLPEERGGPRGSQLGKEAEIWERGERGQQGHQVEEREEDSTRWTRGHHRRLLVRAR